MGAANDRERMIAEHVLRYGLTTRAALRLTIPGLGDKAAARLTERLVASGWLGRRRLPGGGRYFVLGPRAARELSVPAGRTYGYQALVNRVGVLYFAARLGVKVFTAAEFRARFPELVMPGLATAGYYVDKGDTNRLGFIHVDHGRTGARLLTKMSSRIGTRLRSEAFAELIRGDRFLIAIATPTEEKTRAIREELASRGPGPAKIRVETVPELLPLLVERPGKASPRTRTDDDA